MSTTLYPAKLSISLGNKKMGGIANISLPPIVTCSKDVPCKKACYALKSYRMYPNVKKAWDSNWELYQTNPNSYFNQIASFLDTYKKGYFRYHVAGDMPNKSYLYRMRYLAEAFPNIQFLAFTKRQWPLDTALAYPHVDNLIVRGSTWPTWEAFTPLKAHYVPKGQTAPNGAFTCPGACTTCKACFHDDVTAVYFPHH